MEPVQAVIGHEAGYTLYWSNLSQGLHTETDKVTVESPTDITLSVSLDCGRMLDYLNMGCTCKLDTERPQVRFKPTMTTMQAKLLRRSQGGRT